MADQQGTPDNEGTPEPANTPQEGTGTEEQSTATEGNWEDRYKEAQSWGTRLAQENAELKREAELIQALRSDDPNLQQQALEALGYGIETGEEPSDDPTEALQRELEELKQWRDEFTSGQQHNEQLATIESHVERELSGLGDLTEAEGDWIVARAVALPPTPEGLPDIQAAHAEFRSLIDAQKQAWARTKPRAALTSAAGQEGTQAPNLDTHQGRVDYAMARLQAEQQQ